LKVVAAKLMIFCGQNEQVNKLAEGVNTLVLKTIFAYSKKSAAHNLNISLLDLE